MRSKIPMLIAHTNYFRVTVVKKIDGFKYNSKSFS